MAHERKPLTVSFFLYLGFHYGYLPRSIVCTGYADRKHEVDGSLRDKSQAQDGPLKETDDGFLFFIWTFTTVISLVLLFAPFHSIYFMFYLE